MPKLSDLRKLLQITADENIKFCSFELSPVKNNDFYQSFFAETNKYCPLFYALTWHMKDKTKKYLSLELIDKFPSNTLLHLIGSNLTHADVLIILKQAWERGVTNIFALRGDFTAVNSDFPYAIDLVRFIRNHFGDKFCICVAGYPEMHPNSPSKELDLFYLKEKVDAGADFIISQIVFEANVFIKFVEDCREIGISVPIIPGILPILDYMSFKKMVKICNIKVPQDILYTLQSIKGDDEVRKYGIELTTSIIKDIIESKTALGFHLFTLNRISLTCKICDRVGISS